MADEQSSFNFENREPLARDTDPGTSHIAAGKITTSGKRTSQKLVLWQWMRSHGINSPEEENSPQRPGTSREISRVSGFAHPMVHKRLPDLRNDGYVRNGPMRTCRVSGEYCLTRYAVVPEKPPQKRTRKKDPKQGGK